jgi:hypothetical protein
MGEKKIAYGAEPDDLDELDEMLGKQRRERQFRKDMARWKAQWDAGDRTAAARATHECVIRRVSDLGLDADWLIDAVRELTVSAMSDQDKRDRRAWAGHLAKWEALTDLLERGDELFARKPVPGELRDDRGTNMERARAAVSDMLKKEKKKGRGSTEAAVKFSYDLVNEAGGKAATFESYKAVLRERAKKKKGPCSG